MVIDGRALADGILTRVRERVSLLNRAPRLSIITCAPTFETTTYLTLKEKRAREVGIEVSIIELNPTSTTSDVIRAIGEAAVNADAIVVQLPLPSQVDREQVVNAVPPSHDVDALNPRTTEISSPVVGAIREILHVYNIHPFEKHVTVIGCGRLVGLPAYQWFVKCGAHVSVVTRDTIDIGHYTKNADIIVSGAGVPRLLTTDMVKEGVVVLDAGTSEDGGVLVGDVDPNVAKKAALFTPVPRGIGPMTIAVLLENVVEIASRKDFVV